MNKIISCSECSDRALYWYKAKEILTEIVKTKTFCYWNNIGMILQFPFLRNKNQKWNQKLHPSFNFSFNTYSLDLENF